MPSRQKIVDQLIKLLNSNPSLNDAFISSLKEARQPGLSTPEGFYTYLDKILTHIPSEPELMPTVREFYFVLSKSPGDVLRKDKAFNDWINEFVATRGNFLDTVESAETLDSYIKNPKYNIDDYYRGPSGWLTYNQFLARQVKPGRRPVADRCNDRIIVSPADSECKGVWPITPEATVTAKGTTYSIDTLLNGSEYKEKFKEGIFTHSFLGIEDYHRYHTPVSGVVREVRKIPANTWVTETRKEDGSLENSDDVGFQFEHTRGYIILESAVGFVVVMPVGMGHISSVNFTAEEGVHLVKGEEFGFFGFGGSDMIMLFEKGRVKLITEVGKHYKQGEIIGHSL